MNSRENNQTGKNAESDEVYAAKLALIGSMLSTLGDGLQTIAAGIALQELKNEKNESQNTENSANQLKQMQSQLDYLTRKVERLEHRSRYN